MSLRTVREWTVSRHICGGKMEMPGSRRYMGDTPRIRLFRVSGVREWKRTGESHPDLPPRIPSSAPTAMFPTLMRKKSLSIYFSGRSRNISTPIKSADDRLNLPFFGYTRFPSAGPSCATRCEYVNYCYTILPLPKIVWWFVSWRKWSNNFL